MPSVESHGTQVPLRYVGIGASAGGLQALEELFDHMLPDTGMSFIVIQHLSPEFESQMDHLPRSAHVDASRVDSRRHGRQPQHRLCSSPGKEAILSGNRLLLTDRSENDKGLSYPIDEFLRSIAHNVREKIGGHYPLRYRHGRVSRIREIYAAGGLVMAQTLDSAAFDGMHARRAIPVQPA